MAGWLHGDASAGDGLADCDRLAGDLVGVEMCAIMLAPSLSQQSTGHLIAY